MSYPEEIFLEAKKMLASEEYVFWQFSIYSSHFHKSYNQRHWLLFCAIFSGMFVEQIALVDRDDISLQRKVQVCSLCKRKKMIFPAGQRLDSFTAYNQRFECCKLGLLSYNQSTIFM
jgi:hypothetical protein